MWQFADTLTDRIHISSKYIHVTLFSEEFCSPVLALNLFAPWEISWQVSHQRDINTFGISQYYQLETLLNNFEILYLLMQKKVVGRYAFTVVCLFVHRGGPDVTITHDALDLILLPQPPGHESREPL